MLVLSCGHMVARPQYRPKSVHALFEPLERKLAPRSVQCHFCASGVEEHDPWILIRALGEDVP